MYLKSMELQGFKSFAHKIVLEFHNGITGIVGPNGSGKSNIADAVRWVLGEQSARELRGASMTDVIFSGTESRKPLSYAYVSITLDNSDHMLPVDYNEVTIARRVYRSGESEYLMNGVTCRLKDVNELFYDTGIGKEGYSIIGQGQIEKILSGKPEDRRELFDEAVGIVKYKKRKQTSLKKLAEEEDDLTRISDILNELEERVGPLEKQAETARDFLSKRQRLKDLDVNMFLMDIERLDDEEKDTEDKYRIANDQLTENNAKSETMKKKYDSLEQEIDSMDEQIEDIRNRSSEADINREKLESQIRILEEQIRFAEDSDKNFDKRRQNILSSRKEHEDQKAGYTKDAEEIRDQLALILRRLGEAKAGYDQIEEQIEQYSTLIEKDNQEKIALLQKKAELQSEKQKNLTLKEQTAIRKSQLSQRMLSRRTEEETLSANEASCRKIYDDISRQLDEARSEQNEQQKKASNFSKERDSINASLRESVSDLTRKKAQLESLRNIAERYDGYGHAIRFVMEQQKDYPGILGVVADLIHVEKKYETAIETALGGNIQNIVTEDEDTAKQLISMLKKGRHGRVTFLPLTSVRGRGSYPDQGALREKGVIGLANELVNADIKYTGVLSHLLGQVVVVDGIDRALAIAKKYHYRMHIVTLEGEYLRPGGALTGGSFKNTSSLLSRGREIDQLESAINELSAKEKDMRNRLEDIETAIALLSDDKEETDARVSELSIKENTAKINLENALKQLNALKAAAGSLKDDASKIDTQLKEIEENASRADQELKAADDREHELDEEISKSQKLLDEISGGEDSASQAVSDIQIEEAQIRQKMSNAEENIIRIDTEIEKDDANLKSLEEEAHSTRSDAEEKKKQIEEIKETIKAADAEKEKLKSMLEEAVSKKNDSSRQYKGIFDQKEEISRVISNLEKEILRLESLREKNQAKRDELTSYMWDQYELTPHAALELKNEELNDASALKKEIAQLKTDIRLMGDVNVHAIDEFREVNERYQFLKGQHDDLVDAKEKLLTVIDDLDKGMREQFTKGFADIQREFDASFKELFGGGHGRLELVEGEDLLESGIRIIAQPPGKKLQNMMQLSGGEKSLTAIALLFAIQNLKPSPFCLLDEIEAALDDNNVDRFANYLHKLTKNTQFIVITHRRGTMNAADRLYGITMQEKGVSTLVSVNLVENELD